jgi:hypothetical protein
LERIWLADSQIFAASCCLFTREVPFVYDLWKADFKGHIFPEKEDIATGKPPIKKGKALGLNATPSLERSAGCFRYFDGTAPSEGSTLLMVPSSLNVTLSKQIERLDALPPESAPL